MKLKNPKAWKKWQDANKDDVYGMGVLKFAERWADLMEAEIKRKIPLEEMAETTSHDADTEGITGFMYGAAVQCLVECWIHGDELRAWHNAQYGKSGEQAQATGGTVNPAIISFDVPDDMSDEQFIGLLGDAIEESGIGRMMSNEEFQAWLKKTKKEKRH